MILTSGRTGWNGGGGMPDLTPLRIGVTGSRTYSDKATIRSAFVDACQRGRPHEGHVLVHGQCDPWHPDTHERIPWAPAKQVSPEVQGRFLGADWLCEWVALNLNWEGMRWVIERHPAHWYPRGRFDRAAGFRRNEAMVGLGADEWEAFLAPCVDGRCRQPRPHASHGSVHCLDRAGKAGIPVFSFRQGLGPVIATPGR